MKDFLNHPETERIISSSLQEDIGPGDYTSLSTIPNGTQSKAQCLIKEDGIIAGIAFAKRVFERMDANLVFDQLKEDGQRVQKGEIAFYVSGDAQTILQGERLVLNVMQRMSGIATRTRHAADLIADLPCQVLDTRKTTPLIRHLEKWAVAIGGGTNHRFGLYDMVLIKDNHVDFAGGLTKAVLGSKAYLEAHHLDLEIEVETRNLNEVKEALATKVVDRILLDNMSLDELRAAVELIGDQCKTEASGGITNETLRGVAETGVDFVSMGALTHSVKSLDISLKSVE